jgi:L-ascorbate metabolism protein UlaG (beta-lactamase superfamily)
VTHLGYIVEAGNNRLWFTGDPINSFAELADLVGPVKALNPNTGFLTTHPTEGEFPFFDGSVEMARRTGLKTAVPSHYQCFAKRTYDPDEWAARFSREGDPHPFVIPYNTHALFPLEV